MHTRSWNIIKDDSKKTFEVCGQSTNEDGFVNRAIAMQRASMNVTWVVQPITNKVSSKELVKFVGYTREDRLFDRLLNELARRNRESSEDWIDE